MENQTSTASPKYLDSQNNSSGWIYGPMMELLPSVKEAQSYTLTTEEKEREVEKEERGREKGREGKEREEGR